MIKLESGKYSPMSNGNAEKAIAPLHKGGTLNSMQRPMPKDTSIFPHPNIPHLRSALLVTHKGGIKASCFIVPNVLSLLLNI